MARVDTKATLTLGEVESERRDYKTYQRHEEAILDLILKEINVDRIHCFGDSHRAVFKNQKKIICHNVGAGTAYNLTNERSKTGAGRKIFEKIKDIDSDKEALLLVFGEIDCMEHVYKNTLRSNEGSKEIIRKLTTRYIEFINELRNKGFKIIVYGPSFSGYALNSHGTQIERNTILRKFNQEMKKRISSMKEAYFVEINSILIDGENKSRMNFSEDGRHLDKFPNESTIIQAIIFGKLLAEIQNKKDSNKDIELEEIEEGSEAFEYLLNEKREITKTTFSNTYIVNGSKFIDMGKGIYIQDLMTHMRIKTIKIKLDAQDTIRKKNLR